MVDVDVAQSFQSIPERCCPRPAAAKTQDLHRNDAHSAMSVYTLVFCVYVTDCWEAVLTTEMRWSHGEML